MLVPVIPAMLTLFVTLVPSTDPTHAVVPLDTKALTVQKTSMNANKDLHVNMMEFVSIHPEVSRVIVRKVLLVHDAK